MKILFLPNNTASLITTNVAGLQEIGIEAVGFNFAPFVYQSKNQIHSLSNDKSILKRLKLNLIFVFKFIYHLSTATHVHWVYGSNSKIANILIKIVGLLKKRKIIEFCGSDIRSIEEMCSDIPYFKPDYFDEKGQKDLGTNKSSLRTQLKFRKYNYHPLTNSIEISEYIDKKIFPKFFTYNRSVDFDRILKDYRPPKENKLPVILHIPSNPVVKGTSFFIEAAERLKKEGLADYKMFTGVEHSKVLKIIPEADIIVDQLIIGEYGIFSMESMLFQKPTVCFIRNKLSQKYVNEFDGFPIINANVENLYEVLKDLLSKRDQWAEIGLRGKEYTERYHHPRVNALRLKEIYNSL
jgi:hypothetical protein